MLPQSSAATKQTSFLYIRMAKTENSSQTLSRSTPKGSARKNNVVNEDLRALDVIITLYSPSARSYLIGQ